MYKTTEYLLFIARPTWMTQDTTFLNEKSRATLYENYRI